MHNCVYTALMFTHCPNCRAAFSITDQQLNIAVGIAHCNLVRCGICEHVFDARLYLFNESSPGKREQNQPPPDVPSTSPPATRINDLESLDKQLHEQTTDDIKTDADLAKTSPPAVRAYPRGADANIQGMDLNKAVPPGTIADQVAELERQTGRFRALRWLGALMITALIIVIGAQITAVTNVSLIPAPQRAQICQWLTCVKPVARDLDKIDVLNRSIYSHQTKQNALMVTITMINRAQFPQAYPVIQLRFLNIKGEVIAARQFGPNHYLHTVWKPENLMTPNVPVSIKLELEDTGEEVMSYDFDFL